MQNKIAQNSKNKLVKSKTNKVQYKEPEITEQEIAKLIKEMSNMQQALKSLFNAIKTKTK